MAHPDVFSSSNSSRKTWIQLQLLVAMRDQNNQKEKGKAEKRLQRTIENL